MAGRATDALVLSGSTRFVGGDLLTIGGQARTGIAALDAATGSATDWNPSANSTVSALVVSGSTVYAGGEFTTVGGSPQSHIAAISDATTDVVPRPNVRPLALRLDIQPNPVHVATRIAFSLHADVSVTLDLLDVAGRKFTGLVHDRAETAGWHAVEFRPPGLPAGLYLVRLRAGRELLCGKVMLLQ